MNRLNRRRFLALSSAGAASVVLVACGNDSPSAEDVNPTQIPDVAGAPPTLAPITATPESGGGESAGGGGESGGRGGNKVTVEAGDIYFDPTEFTVPAGGTIVLNNVGALQHDFAVDEWGEVVIGPLNGGESGEYTVPEDAKDGDQFTFYCSIPGHRTAGMEGTLTIGAASGGGEEEAAAGDESAGGGGAASAEIEAGDIYFDPTEFSIAPGGTITLNNAGVLQHDFAVDEWGEVVIGPLNGGESGDFTVPDDAKPGDSFTFYCSIPGHRAAGMEGTVTIAEAGGGGDEAAAAGGAEEEATAEASPEEEEATAVASPASEAAAGGGASEVALTAGDLFFDPTEFEVAPGGTITLTNEGMLEHDLAVDDWGGVVIDILQGGDSGSYTVPEDAQPGDSFEFYCSVPGHKEAGMVGTLTIAEAGGGDEAAAAGGAEEEATPEEAATPAGEAASGGGEVGEVTISAFEFGFDPAEVEVSPGATITMTNDGHIEHDIAVDAWGGEVVPLTTGGEQATGTVPSDAQVGETFEFYCTVAGHKESGMVGKFTIVEGAAGGAATASPEASPAAEGTGHTLTIAANEWNFSPSEFEAAPGDTIVLRNDGAMAHDMSSEEWGEPFIPDVKHGETGSFVVPDDAEVGSKIEFYSMNQGAKKLGMTGTITIVKETKDSFTAPPAPPATPAASPVASPGASPAAAGGGKTIEVKAIELAFDPAEFEASPGDTIKLTNEGMLEHDMASETLGVTMVEMLSPGESGEYVIPDDASGEVEIHCTVSGHKEAGMVGTITIV